MTLWEHSNLLDQSRDKSDILGFSSTLVQFFGQISSCHQKNALLAQEVEIVQHGARFKLVLPSLESTSAELHNFTSAGQNPKKFDCIMMGEKKC